MREGWVALGAACVILAATSASAVTITDETRCKIVKLKSVVKELKDKAQCYERSLKGGVPVNQDCFKRAEQKRERLFDRAEERGGCATTKDGASFGTRIDSFLQEVTQTLEGAPKSAAKATPAPPVEKAAAADPAESASTSGAKAAAEREKAEGKE